MSVSVRSWFADFLVDKPVTCFQDLLQRYASLSALSLACWGVFRFLLLLKFSGWGWFVGVASLFCLLGLVVSFFLTFHGLMLCFERLPMLNMSGFSGSSLRRFRLFFLVFFVWVPSVSALLLFPLFSPFFFR